MRCRALLPLLLLAVLAFVGGSPALAAISSLNSTTTPLAMSATYTGTGELALGFGGLTLVVYSDVAGTVYVDQSPDGTNWDYTSSTSVSAATGAAIQVQLFGTWFRVRYINGGTIQTAFRLTTIKREIMSPVPASADANVTIATALPAGTNVIGGVTIADGSNVNQGANADAVVAAGAAGTASAKLRRLTTDLAALLALLPSTIGTKASAASLSVVLASDQAAVPVSQSGTWTVQPGNTANTTAWKVDGSAVTQPVSIATAPVLVAGSAIIGNIRIDQTTPGTTNGVSLAQVGTTTVATGHGVSGTGVQRVELPTDGTGVVGLNASEAHVGIVGGATVTVTAAFTRPADTTAYAALDTVSNSTSAPAILTFTNAFRVSGGSGYVTKLRVMTDQSTCTARFRLHLYNVVNPTLINDNAPYTSLWSERTSKLGSVDVPAMATEGTGSTMAGASNRDDRTAVVGVDRNIYVQIETLDAFTPASGQSFYVELTVEQN